MRKSKLTRATSETEISVELNLDGSGTSIIESGVGFLDHMLTSFSKHGEFDMVIQCKGDVEIDDHHSTEDIGIVLGKAFAQCLEDKKGIKRFATAFTPMDEALAFASLDISGRGFLQHNATYPSNKVGTFDTELVEEFFRAFAMNANLTLHINMMYGSNTHHMIEAVFKSVARALKEAVTVEGDLLRSTKGAI